jgi:hypothetical protein
MKKSFNYLAFASCFILASTLAHADSKAHTDADASHGNQQIDGSGSVSNKMDDTGKDPKERSRSKRDDWDKQRDNAWHKNSDGTWDKKRDDEWHKKSDSTHGGSTSQSHHH